jgi:hypothetical protein
MVHRGLQGKKKKNPEIIAIIVLSIGAPPRTAKYNKQYIQSLTIKFANSPQCVSRGSSGQKLHIV